MQELAEMILLLFSKQEQQYPVHFIQRTFLITSNKSCQTNFMQRQSKNAETLTVSTLLLLSLCRKKVYIGHVFDQCQI